MKARTLRSIGCLLLACSGLSLQACSPTKDSDIWETYAIQERRLEQSHPVVPLPKPGSPSAVQDEEHAPAAQGGHASATHAPSGPAPAEVLADLLSGNKRFYQQKALHPDQSMVRRAGLVSGQKPKAIILSCSDSRVPPELLFDQGFGNLFVVRTAGEVADSVAIASIEYAIEHLGSNLLLVLGHESCGAVKATLETPAKKSSGSKHIDHLLSQIRPNIGSSKAQHGESPLDKAVRENVSGVASALLKKSAIIQHAVEQDTLMIAQGVYQLSTGRVEVWF